MFREKNNCFSRQTPVFPFENHAQPSLIDHSPILFLVFSQQEKREERSECFTIGFFKKFDHHKNLKITLKFYTQPNEITCFEREEGSCKSVGLTFQEDKSSWLDWLKILCLFRGRKTAVSVVLQSSFVHLFKCSVFSGIWVLGKMGEKWNMRVFLCRYDLQQHHKFKTHF